MTRPRSKVRCFPFPRGVSLSWLCRPDGEWSPRQVYCTVQHCTLYTVHCTADTTLDSIHCILLHWDYTGQCEWLLRYAGAAVRGEQTWISLYWLSTSHFANIKLRIKVKRLPLDINYRPKFMYEYQTYWKSAWKNWTKISSHHHPLWFLLILFTILLMPPMPFCS